MAAARPGQVIGLDFRRNPHENAIDAPGTVSLNPMVMLMIPGVMPIASCFVPGTHRGALLAFLNIHGDVLSSYIGVKRHNPRTAIPPEPYRPSVPVLSRWAPAFASGLRWLPKRISAFAGAFACLSFRISGLLRFVPWPWRNVLSRSFAFSPPGDTCTGSRLSCVVNVSWRSSLLRIG